MLVLSRRRDETIMIGDDVEITVVGICGTKVLFGITAPTRIAVHRKEVYEAILEEEKGLAHVRDVVGPGRPKSLVRRKYGGPGKPENNAA